MKFYFNKIGRLSKQCIKIQIIKSQNILKIRDDSKNKKDTDDIRYELVVLFYFLNHFHKRKFLQSSPYLQYYQTHQKMMPNKDSLGNFK